MSNNITLVDKERQRQKVVSKDKNVAEVINNYFINIRNILNLNHQEVLTVTIS